MKQEDKKLIIDLLFAKYKENKDEHILDLIKKVEKINFVVEKIILDSSYVDIKNKSNIDFTDLFIDVLDLSNMRLEMIDRKVIIKNRE